MAVTPTPTTGFTTVVRAITAPPSPPTTFFFHNVNAATVANQALVMHINCRNGANTPVITGVTMSTGGSFSLVNSATSVAGAGILNGQLTATYVFFGPPTTGQFDVLITFDAIFTTSGLSATLESWQNASQVLADWTANAGTPVSSITAGDTATQASTIGGSAPVNSVMRTVVGMRPTTGSIVMPSTAAGGDTLFSHEDNGGRAQVYCYQFDLSAGGTHTFSATTYTSGTSIQLSQYSFTIPPLGSDTAQITDFAGGQIFQSTTPWTGTTATVKFAGTYTGAGAASAKFGVFASDGVTPVVAYATPGSYVFGSGASSGTLSVPAGGGKVNGYRAAIQTYDSGGSVLKTSVGSSLWGVGDVVVFAGSSTGEKMVQNPTTLTPNANLSMFFCPHEVAGGAWQTPTGDPAITLGNGIITLNGGTRPVAIISGAVGGSYLGQWYNAPSGTFPTVNTGVNDNWNSFSALNTTFACWFDFANGTNDARDNDYTAAVSPGPGYGFTSPSQIQTLWASYFTNIETTFGRGSAQMIVHTCCPRFENTGEGIGNNCTWLRTSELNACDARANTYVVPEIDLALQADKTHLVIADQIVLGQRCLNVVAKVAYGQSVNTRGPYIDTANTASFKAVGGKLRVTFVISPWAGVVNQLNNGTFALDPSCFYITNSGGTAQTITGITIVSATQCDITCTNTVIPGWLAQYAAGQNPGGGATPGNPNLPCGTP